MKRRRHTGRHGVGTIVDGLVPAGGELERCSGTVWGSDGGPQHQGYLRELAAVRHCEAHANRAIATHAQPRTRKSPQMVQPDSYAQYDPSILTCIAIPRLGHAEPMVGFWRRHHHSHRQIRPSSVRQALARRLDILTSPLDRDKLGGAFPYTNSQLHMLTRVDPL